MSERPTGISRSRLVWLLTLALALRGILLVAGPWRDLGKAKEPDSSRYLLLADNLRDHSTFGLHEEEGNPWRAVAALRRDNGTLPAADANGLHPESFRTPGYPAFIALVYVPWHDPRAVLLIQCLLGGSLAPLVAIISQTLGVSARGAFVAGLLWAVHPALIVYDLLLLTESLFNACVVGGLCLAARALSWRGALAAGTTLGLASLVRPLGVLYVPIGVALIWLRVPHKWWATLNLVAMAMLLPALWIARNERVGEGPRITPVGELNLLYHTVAYAIAEERGEDWLKTWPERCQELTARLAERLHPDDDVIKAVGNLAMEEIKAHPVAVARVYGKSLVKLLLDHSLGKLCAQLDVTYESSGLFSRLVLREQDSASGGKPGLLVLALIWVSGNALIALAALVGTLKVLRQRNWPLLAVVLTLVLLTVATLSAGGIERYRLSLMLPLFTLVGYLVPDREVPPSQPRPAFE